MPDHLMSPEELAEWLGIPVRTVYAWRHRGVGPRGAKVGKHVRYRRADAEAWLADQYGDQAVTP